MKLPVDLQESVIEAAYIQALGQATEMQLASAVGCKNATLSIKKRLACEQLSYFGQAHYCFSTCDNLNGYGKKHLSFIKWNYLEAKAAAYYYHGLITDKGHDGCMSLDVLPNLPEFELSLKADEYQMPDKDAAWESEKWVIPNQTLKTYLTDDEEDD
nr:BRO1 domain-containing protein BROX homolog [Tanacetum cinerariifolium]